METFTKLLRGIYNTEVSQYMVCRGSIYIILCRAQNIEVINEDQNSYLRKSSQ